MEILIKFTPDELVKASETGTLQALFEATKAAEKRVEKAAKAVNIVQASPAASTANNPPQAPITPTAPTPPAIPTTPPVAQPTPMTPAFTPSAPASPVPTTTQTYTTDQLAVASTQLVDAGRIAELQKLLASFGVQALTQLPKEQYGAFATQLRALGAKI